MACGSAPELETLEESFKAIFPNLSKIIISDKNEVELAFAKRWLEKLPEKKKKIFEVKRFDLMEKTEEDTAVRLIIHPNPRDFPDPNKLLKDKPTIIFTEARLEFSTQRLLRYENEHILEAPMWNLSDDFFYKYAFVWHP